MSKKRIRPSQFAHAVHLSPPDFMFRLSAKEAGRGGRRVLPYPFTEQGAVMLSSVLNSERAVKVNMAVMPAFVRLREALETNRELGTKFSELETRVDRHDDEIAALIEAIRQLIAPPAKPIREFGFHVRETSPRYGTRKRR